MRKILLFLSMCVLFACGAEKKVSLRFAQPVSSQKYTDEQSVAVQLQIEGSVDSVALTLNRTYAIGLENYGAKILPKHLLLGENVLVAEAYKSGQRVAKKYMLFEVGTNHTPAVWKPTVLRKLKHTEEAFTQGLFYHNGKLYESTGENGHSRLMEYDLRMQNVVKTKKLAYQYFGEGSTIWQDKIYYITWNAGKCFVFDVNAFEKQNTLSYDKYTKEGWGLTTIGDELVMSNGTEKLLFFNPETMQLKKTLSVVSHRGKQLLLNELEYDGTCLYANVWMTSEIMVINPKTGRVEAIIDCTSIVAQEKKAQQNPNSDVLNGIAYNPNTQTYYLTGKNWDYIYEVRLR